LFASQPDFPVIIIYMQGNGTSIEITYGKIPVVKRVATGTDHLGKRVYLEIERHWPPCMSSKGMTDGWINGFMDGCV
jgi:hypothetical protein